MRRLLAFLGGMALLRAWLRLRQARALAPAADPRAEELRQRLEESRSLAADQDEFAAGETPVDLSPETAAHSPEAAGDALGPEERRHEVHERGRAAVDEMRGQS